MNFWDFLIEKAKDVQVIYPGQGKKQGSQTPLFGIGELENWLNMRKVEWNDHQDKFLKQSYLEKRKMILSGRS